jgi:putative spermidine/putrescine transport system permease protein
MSAVQGGGPGGQSGGNLGGIGVMRNWLGRGMTDATGRRRSARTVVASWLIFVAMFLYFFLPLLATFLHSIKPRPNDIPDPTLAYRQVLADERFYVGLGYSFLVGVITIIISLLIIVPTAYWVRLRAPRLRPVVEFLTLMPFVVPPVVFVFGLIRTFGGPPFQLLATNFGSDLVLVAAYVILSFPYMYRAVDTGLATIDVRTLTEASQSLGASWARILWRVIFPNLRTAILSGAFLTLAIVIGEYTIAQFLARTWAFGPYLSLLGRNAPYTPAVVSLISFALTWIAMFMIAYLGRGSKQVQVAGAR